jgi:hypothetical protein
MTTLQIHLPDDLATKIFRRTTNAEAFIVDLLRSQIQELSLKDEYHLANIENKNLLAEFETIDLENWE